jgi:hypothetical protein
MNRFRSYTIRYKSNGFVSKNKVHGILVNFVAWIWVDLIGLHIWNKEKEDQKGPTKEAAISGKYATPPQDKSEEKQEEDPFSVFKNINFKGRIKDE